jgi:predicted DNA binding CopG/RHH family protein
MGNFRVTPTEANKIRDRLAEKGMKFSQYVRELIDKDIRNINRKKRKKHKGGKTCTTT